MRALRVLQEAIEAGAADAQNLRGANAIAAAGLKQQAGMESLSEREARRQGDGDPVSALGAAPTPIAGFCKCSGKSSTSMKSLAVVRQALETTFSSSRTLPGQGCCKKIVWARRVNPRMVLA